MKVASLFAIILASSLPSATASPCKSESYQWRGLPSLPQPRQEHSVAMLDNRIYVTGGILSNISFSPTDPPMDPAVLFSSIQPTSTTQYFDIESAIWHDAAPLPTSINHGNIATVSGKLFLLGGLSGSNLSSWNALTDTFVYDAEQDRWSPLAPMPPETARGASAVAVYGDEIFLAGGMTQLQLFPEPIQASVATVTSYNTRTNTWTISYPPLPGARDHVAGGVLDHTLYVTGGRDHGQYNWKNDTWALDLTDISAGWISKAPMLTARGGLAYATVDNNFYTFGGEGNPNNPDTEVFDNVEVYRPVSDTWKALPRMQVPRHGMGAAAIGKRIYIPGGGVRISAAPTTSFDVFELH